MFKLLYLFNPALTLAFGYAGKPWTYIFVGLGISMALLLLDSVAVAMRLSGFTGAGGAVRFLGGMFPTLLTMLVPASLWNVGAYFAGLGLARLIG